MIRDTIDSLRVTLADRVGSPFVSATFVALVFVNWKLTLLVFSNVPYHEKIRLISDIYSPVDEAVNGLLLYPVFFGAFWTFAWPIADYLISGYWFWIKSKISNVRLKAERKKSLSHEEASDIYMAIDRQESRYLDVIKVRENRIEELNQNVSQEYERVNNLQKEILKKDTVISDLRVDLDRVVVVN